MHEGRIFFFFLLFTKVTFRQLFYAVKMFSTRGDLTGFSESQSQEAQALPLVEFFFFFSFLILGREERKTEQNNKKTPKSLLKGAFIFRPGADPLCVKCVLSLRLWEMHACDLVGCASGRSLLLSGAGADKARGAILCVPLAGTSSRGPEPPGRTVPLVRVQEGRRAPGGGGSWGGRVAGVARVAQLSSPSRTLRAVYFHCIRRSVIKLTAPTWANRPFPEGAPHPHWAHSPFSQHSWPLCTPTDPSGDFKSWI